MREIRTYGSVRGVARKGHSYRDKMSRLAGLLPCLFLPSIFLPFSDRTAPTRAPGKFAGYTIKVGEAARWEPK